MLNPEIREIYTPEVVGELEKLAKLYQDRGRRVLVSTPVQYRHMVIPKYLFVANRTLADTGRGHSIVFNVADEHMKQTDDYPLPLFCDISWYDAEDAETGMELWV